MTGSGHAPGLVLAESSHPRWAALTPAWKDIVGHESGDRGTGRMEALLPGAQLLLLALDQHLDRALGRDPGPVAALLGDDAEDVQFSEGDIDLDWAARCRTPPPTPQSDLAARPPGRPARARARCRTPQVRVGIRCLPGPTRSRHQCATAMLLADVPPACEGYRRHSMHRPRQCHRKVPTMRRILLSVVVAASFTAVAAPSAHAVNPGTQLECWTLIWPNPDTKPSVCSSK